MLWSEANGNKSERGRPVTLSSRRFESLVTRALTSLPEEFQSRLENVAVVIEEDPPRDMPDIMGLYEGVPLIHRSLEDIGLPDQITIFKGPIERACCNEKEIEAEIRLTVLHEVGHYFGLDEAQLE